MNTQIFENAPESTAVVSVATPLCACGLCGFPLPMKAATSLATGPQSATIPVSTLVNPLQPPAPPATVIAKSISGDPRIDSLIDGANFRFNNGSPVGTPVTVTFSFPSALPATYVGDNAKGWQPFSNDQKAAVRDVLSQLQNQVNVTFQEVADGTMRFSNNIQTVSAGYAFFPNANGDDLDSDTWIAIGSNSAGVVRGVLWLDHSGARDWPCGWPEPSRQLQRR